MPDATSGDAVSAVPTENLNCCIAPIRTSVAGLTPVPSIRAAVPDTWTGNVQPRESSAVQPPAQTPVLHHALPHSVQKHRLGPCSKQVLPPSSHGAPSPKQTVQRELHHVKELERGGPLCGSGQDAGALQVQHHRPEPLPAAATGVFHAGAAQSAQRRDPETRAWRVQPGEGDGEQSSGPRLFSGHQTLRICDPACFECFRLISPIQILQLIKLDFKNGSNSRVSAMHFILFF